MKKFKKIYAFFGAMIFLLALSIFMQKNSNPNKALALSAEDIFGPDTYFCSDGQIIGDINNDGVVTADDSDIVGKMDAGTINPPSDICCVDADQDGGLTAFDALRIGEIADGTAQSPGKCGESSAGAVCKDSDGGINLYAKGSIEGSNLSTGAVPQDYCVSYADAPTLVEYSCKDSSDIDYYGFGVDLSKNYKGGGYANNHYSGSFLCPNGCENGACILKCSAGQQIGDVDGDGKITEADSNITGKIAVGLINAPADICCADMNKDGAVNSADTSWILGITEGIKASPGKCGENNTVVSDYSCNSGQIIGDINNDGKVTSDDSDITGKIAVGLINAPADICCADMNKDGAVNSADTSWILGITEGIKASPGKCGENNKEPNILITDIHISAATKLINVTVKNSGEDLNYQKTYWIYAQDLDNNEKYAGMLTVLKSGESDNVILDDHFYLNKTSSRVAEKESGKYKIKAWLGDSVMEKTIALTDANENTLEIFNVSTNTKFAKGDKAVINWETNIDSTGYIEFMSKKDSKQISEGFKKKHSVIVSNLTPFTKYTFRIYADDKNGKTDTSLAETLITEGSLNSTLPDLTIQDVYIEKTKWADNFFTGNLNIRVANIGSSVAEGSYRIIGNVILPKNWFGGTNVFYIDKLEPKAIKKITFPVSNDEFDGLPVKVSAWIDSNAIGGINNTLTNDNIMIVESNEYNNTFSGYIKIDDSVSQIYSKSKLIYDNKFGEILSELKVLKDTVKEQQAEIKYLRSLKQDVKKLSVAVESAINNFITYGVDENTKKLGAGERAAVMYSYKAAFAKLPETEEELADAIKIANGRWPSVTNEDAEKKSKEQFQKIYKRIPDMNNTKDNAAVTVMAYGLRQRAENRNLNSEKTGINIFKGIYNKLPETTEEWNMMQAITYSGAAREKDTDG
ncbi:MAG: dockerin type I domain-containing protein, partial [bacterium]